MKSAYNVYTKTYGCQMNFYDTDRMLDSIGSDLQYKIVEDHNQADIIIVNTCNIRENAANKVFSILGKFKNLNQNNNTIIVVAGCVSQAEGDLIIQAVPYVNLVIGPQCYHKLSELILRLLHDPNHKSIVITEFPTESKFDFLPKNTSSKTSAFISIQEGCDKFCTFCVVPYTRGPEFSRSINNIYNEAQTLVNNGAKEIILLGQNVNAYHGLDNNGEQSDISKLINKIASIDKLERINYMTSHPIDFTDNLIEAHYKEPKLTPFVHLPVQSGSNKILKTMNRKHNISSYYEIMNKLKKLVPNIAISSDFIVGFPGETDEDFAATLKLVKDINFAQAYSFKYSPRPGTPASIMEDAIPEEIKSARLSELNSLLRASSKKFNNKFVGKNLSVMLNNNKQENNVGKSQYMQLVYINNPEKINNNIVQVKINQAYDHILQGTII